MSSVQHLREFICGRLTSATEEIFSEFEKTILPYEEEMERQRRLLDLCWKPKLKLHRVDLHQEPEPPQSEVQQEPEPPQFEVQQEPEPPQIKVEDEELCTNQEEDQLHLKQETDPVLVTVLYEESEPEPDKEQLISQSSAGPEDQDQDSGSDEKMDHTEGHHGNQAGQSATSERLFSCETCGQTFRRLPDLKRHMRIHTGEKPFSCETCGKTFTRRWNLNNHMRIHTGEKPFSCETCGKCFYRKSNLQNHLRVHEGRADVLLSQVEKSFTK